MNTLNDETQKWLNEKFSNNKLHCNEWIYAEDGQLYIRITKHAVNGEFVPTIDVSNVEVFEEFQGKGIFKQLLDTIETIAQQHNRHVFVESVLNDMLLDVLPRYGFKEVRGSMPPSFVKYTTASNQKAFKM
jgi:GNAT superfamily N-acetyltransferase